MNNNIKEKIGKRQEFNYKLLDLIAEYINEHPDIRFGQALVNIGIIQYDEYDDKKETCSTIDPFYEESVNMYDRIMNKIK